MSARKPVAGPSKQVIARRRNAAARQERVIAEGGRQLNMLLEKKPTRALERLQRSTGLPAKQVVAGLLIDGVANLQEVKARLKAIQAKPVKAQRVAVKRRK